MWHLDLIQAFKGLPESPPPRPPEWFLASPVQAQAESCLPPTATTLNVLERHTRVPCSPLSSLPELVLRLVAWLSSNYGCIETRGDSCQEGQQQIPPVHSLILMVMKHLLKLQIRKSGCQGPGEGLSHRAATNEQHHCPWQATARAGVTTTDPVQKRWGPCMV